MDAGVLIKQMLAAREFWVEVDPGKRIKLRRPSEMAVADMLVRDGDKISGIKAEMPTVIKHACGWEGVTEADLLVSGASDPVDFDPTLFATVIEDKRKWYGACAQALVDKVIAHEGIAAETSGN